MLLQLAIMAACAGLGLRLQHTAQGARLRAALWSVNYVAFIPAAGAYALLSLDLTAHLLAIVACGVVAWWLTVAVAYGWARVVYSDAHPRERAATWLAGAFANTGFIGYPLAHLAFGRQGLRLAIVYDQVSLVVPAVVLSTIIARHAAARGGEATLGTWSVRRELLRSIPLWVVLATLLVRVTVQHDPVEIGWLGTIVSITVGPIGFLLLGLSLPLDRRPTAQRARIASIGAVIVRIAAAPGLLWCTARVAGVELPAAMLLIAAMPTAFHPLIIARINGLPVAVIRLAIILSTVLVAGATVVVLTVTR